MGRHVAGWSLVLIVAGCSREVPAAAGTGAEGVVRGYYDALVRKDWTEAYAALHPDSRAKVSAAQFARQAESYRRQLGFEPQQVTVRSCEEHGSEALAHVILKGSAAGGPRSFKDAVVLRQTAGRWGLVLPARFGEGR